MRSGATGEGKRNGGGERARSARVRRRLRVWRWRMARAARRGWILPGLFLGSVVESALLPWPIEFPLLAEMLRGRRHVLPAALAVALGSFAGAMLVYAAGLAAFELVSVWLAPREGFAAGVEAARVRVEMRGALAVFLAMLTPVPVQLTSLAAGLAGIAPVPFALAVLAGRALRYGAMAIVVFWYGDTVMVWWRARSRLVRTLAGLAFLALFLAAFAWTLSG